jgi:hypothetical protein
MSFSNRAAFANAVPAGRSNQAFSSGMQGSPASRAAFAGQSASSQQFPQRSSGTSLNRGLSGVASGAQGFTRSTTPAAGGWPQAQSPNNATGFRSTQSNSNGWHSFGQTSGGAQATTMAPRSFSGSTGTSNGWHVFGQPHQAGETNRSNGFSNYGYSAPQQPYRGSSDFGSSNGQALHLNAPVVQPRSYGYQSPGYGNSGSFRTPAPPRSNYNYSAPRQNYSAPRQNYSAPHYNVPKSSGGGGGGSAHGSGGGGSGSRGGGGGGGGSHGNSSHHR